MHGLLNFVARCSSGLILSATLEAFFEKFRGLARKLSKYGTVLGPMGFPKGSPNSSSRQSPRVASPRASPRLRRFLAKGPGRPRDGTVPKGVRRSGARPSVRMGSYHEWVARILAIGMVAITNGWGTSSGNCDGSHCQAEP